MVSLSADLTFVVLFTICLFPVLRPAIHIVSTVLDHSFKRRSEASLVAMQSASASYEQPVEAVFGRGAMDTIFDGKL